ncbi:MAG: flagellar basal-body MS-ring/collar protein FliF [Patulibacter sp.]|nr:flagellar basal-body MS-ring/collar protein FliF [Patulibacter sp.]
MSYELQNAGTALAVKSADLGSAKVALATAGVNTGAGTKPGMELLDNQKLGASDFQQQVTYQRALEGEIANTISQIDGVDGADVQLTLPEDKLFSDDSTPATAAVLLSGGTSLDPSAVRGIASLVSSSVTGLSTDKVTITDGNGELLWPTADSGTGGSANAKAAAEARYDASIESSVNAMLNRTLGPNKASVQVSTDLNMNEANTEQLAYAAKGTPLQQSVDDETLAGTTPGGGTSGTAANIAGSTAAGAGNGSNYQHKTTTSTFGVGKTVTKTKVAPGAVNKMQVALIMDTSIPAATQASLTKMVSAAAGLNTARGDTITPTALKFATTTVAKKSPLPITPTGIIGMLKYILAGLAALVFLVLASRALRRRESSELGEPKWLSEIESPRPLSELVASLEGGGALGAGATGEMGALGAGEAANPREQLAAVAAQDPERLARQLRQWMTESDA